MKKKQKKKKDLSINPAEIVLAEYNYIAETAFQANEDRARVSQFFIVMFGTVIAALVSSQIENIDIQQLYTAFVIVFVFIFIFGILTVNQLARLRQAWRESIFAMSQIKEEAIKEHPQLASYFRWRRSTIPGAFKPGSVGFNLAIMVALISGLALGSSLALFKLAQGTTLVPLILCLVVSLISSVLVLVLFYWLPLRK